MRCCCPTAETACLVAKSAGLECSPIGPIPAANAPDDTTITSLPRAHRAAMASTNRSTLLTSTRWSEFVSEDDPIFTMTRFAAAMLARTSMVFRPD